MSLALRAGIEIFMYSMSRKIKSMSLARRAWIEIRTGKSDNDSMMMSLARRVWIEIVISVVCLQRGSDVAYA